MKFVDNSSCGMLAATNNKDGKYVMNKCHESTYVSIHVIPPPPPPRTAYNELSRNHVTAQDHVACAFVETHPLIYEVLGRHFVD